jgi:predicted PurR-regulated permease PerM
VKSHEAGPVSLERQILFWAVAVAAIFYVVYLLGSTITPFAAGIVLGYLLDPIVLKLQSLGLNRLGATLLILIAFALGVVIVLILVAPILSNQ